MKNNRGMAVWILVLLLAGCSLVPNRLKIGDNVVTPQKDVSATTLSTLNAGEVLPLAAGSRLVITRFNATAGVPATKDSPAVAAQPERTVTEVIPAKDTQWQRTEASVSANSGTVDTSIREHQIDAQESRPLLWASIGAAVLGGFFIYRAYPTPAICCFGASVVFFIAWKVSGVPSWMWGVGLAAIAGGGALFLGHERGLKTPPNPVSPT